MDSQVTGASPHGSKVASRMYCFTAEQLYALAFECAGVGSGAVMVEAPHVEMPGKVICAVLRRILAEEHGVPAPEGYR